MYKYFVSFYIGTVVGNAEINTAFPVKTLNAIVAMEDLLKEKYHTNSAVVIINYQLMQSPEDTE